MKIKFFKKEKSFKKEKESLWLNINFYWKLAVLFMFLVIIISFAFGYYFFMQMSKESVALPVISSGQTDTVKKERIDKVLEYFSTRETKSAVILNSPAPVVDPSL
ncbi:MAG: hypothetical protein WCG28_04160 [bacterium]